MSEQGFDPNEEENLGKAYDSRLMKRLLLYAKPYWRFFALAFVLLAGSTITDLAGPYLMKIAIDDYMIGSPNPRAVIILGLIYIGAVLIGFLLNYFQLYLLNYTGQSILYNFRQEIFSHLQRMSLSFFDKNPVGRLVTRVTNDTETLNDMYTNVLVTLIKDAFLILGVIFIMFSLNSILALIVLAVIPLLVIITFIFRLQARTVYRRVRTTLARINSVFSENISGMRVIQIFHVERENFKKFQKINDDYFAAGMKEIIVFGIFRPAIEMLAFLVIAAVIWYGGGRVIDSTLQFGVLFAFINYVYQFFNPINDLAEKYNLLQSAMASSERIFMILDTSPEDDLGELELKPESIKGNIEFRNVWFAYKENEWVLREVSFNVPAGTSLAIVGATGAGKTSIINLLNRFYEIQKGEILIDGINIRDIKKESLRKYIGVVLQDVFLFSGTVRDNIVLNESSIPDSDIKMVSQYVNADRFISNLPLGYNEEVKERGATFSSGQRQLLAFARALAFKPSILVLDEATANIDTETELLIQDALKRITSNRTTIIIAHRLSTIQHADNILVLHKGKIRETGTHQELLTHKGMYYNLYNLQYKGL